MYLAFQDSKRLLIGGLLKLGRVPKKGNAVGLLQGKLTRQLFVADSRNYLCYAVCSIFPPSSSLLTGKTEGS